MGVARGDVTVVCLNLAMAVRAELTAAQHQRRRLLSRAWAIVVIAWAFGRTLLVWAAVGDYGINPWIYLVIDLACASVDAITTPRTVLALIDGRHSEAMGWGSASLVAFIIPDIYIFIGTDRLPKSIVTIVCIVIVATLTFTIIGVRRKVLAGRAARAAGCSPAVTPPTCPT